MKRRPFSEGSNIVDSKVPAGFEPPPPASLLGVPTPPADTKPLTDNEKEQINRQVRNTARWSGMNVTESQLVHMEQSVSRTVESIVRAARAQELRDAAKDLPGQFDPDFHNADWLRDRANHIESSQD